MDLHFGLLVHKFHTDTEETDRQGSYIRSPKSQDKGEVRKVLAELQEQM